MADKVLEELAELLVEAGLTVYWNQEAWERTRTFRNVERWRWQDIGELVRSARIELKGTPDGFRTAARDAIDPSEPVTTALEAWLLGAYSGPLV